MAVMTMQVAGSLAARGDAPLGDRCPIERTLRTIGSTTSLLLIREAFYGTTRFDHFWRRVGVTEAAASQRLRQLVDVGVLEKRPYQEAGQRTRYEYVLTPAGLDLMPAVLNLLEWGAKHLPGDGASAITHVGCGAEVRAVAQCNSGHVVGTSEIRIATRRRPT